MIRNGFEFGLGVLLLCLAIISLVSIVAMFIGSIKMLVEYIQCKIEHDFPLGNASWDRCFRCNIVRGAE